MHLNGHVDFRDTNKNVAISVQLVVGAGILKPLDMTSNNITNVGSITCNTLASTGASGQTSSPTRRGVYMGLHSTAPGGIEICTDMNQYIDFTTMSNDCRRRTKFNTTDNDLKIYVNGSATQSITLISAALTTNQVSITRTTGMQSTYAAQGVYMGSIDATAAGIKVSGPNGSYIYFTKPHCVWHGSIDYSNTRS